MKGMRLKKWGGIPKAMARYDAAIEADPHCARAHLNRGNILAAGNRLDEARSAYQLAIACDPNYAAAHFNLGNLSYRVGQFERALGSYQMAIRIKPDFADAFVALANALDSLGRATEAVQIYKRALTLVPGYAEVHFNLGVLAKKQGRMRRPPPVCAAPWRSSLTLLKPITLWATYIATSGSSKQERPACGTLCPSIPNPPNFSTTWR